MPKKLKGPVYGVEWLEVEFGQRPEGWRLYMDKEDCIEKTKEASRNGPYTGGGGYFGPERPLQYFEIPVEGLDDDIKKKLLEKGVAHTNNWWNPKYKSNGTYID